MGTYRRFNITAFCPDPAPRRVHGPLHRNPPSCGLLQPGIGILRTIEQLDARTEALKNDPSAQERAYRNTFRHREPGEKVIYFDED